MAELEDNNTTETAPMSKRDTALERLRGRHPEQEFADDEAAWGQSMDDYDAMEGQLNDYKGREQSMVDMMSKDPRSANFLAAWHQGENPLIAMMRMYGPELKDSLDDPALQDQLAEAQKDYLDRMAKSKELEQQTESNIEQSIAERDAFQQEMGLSDEEMDQVMDSLKQIFEDALVGKFTRASMEMAYKAMNHDNDVAAAADEGEVRGRNAKIDEKLRKRQGGDGVSAIEGANNTQKESNKPQSIFDEARGAS